MMSVIALLADSPGLYVVRPDTGTGIGSFLNVVIYRAAGDAGAAMARAVRRVRAPRSGCRACRYSQSLDLFDPPSHPGRCTSRPPATPACDPPPSPTTL